MVRREERLVFRTGLPWTMRRFVVAHQVERLALIAVLQPVQGEVADEIRAIARCTSCGRLLDELRIVVRALARRIFQ